jgi:hypothetical protein
MNLVQGAHLTPPWPRSGGGHAPDCPAGFAGLGNRTHLRDWQLSPAVSQFAGRTGERDQGRRMKSGHVMCRHIGRGP